MALDVLHTPTKIEVAFWEVERDFGGDGWTVELVRE